MTHRTNVVSRKPSGNAFQRECLENHSVTNFKSLFSVPIPSISTPFMPDGGIDHAHLETMVERYLEWGHAVLMLTAGDSHFACMTDREIADVTGAVLKQVNHRAAVIVADRYFATPAACEFAAEMKRRGADCYMAMPPDWGFSTTPESLVAHYRAIGRIMPVMVVTNVFAPRGPMGFGMEVCRRLLDVPEVVAIKDDVCGPFGRAMAALLSGEKAIISGGQKQNHFDLAAYGAVGHLTTFGRVQPEPARAYWDACARGNLAVAQQIIRRIDMPYFSLISSFRGGFNAGIYGSLELAGLARRCRRAPYETITDADFERLRAFHESVPEILHDITLQSPHGSSKR